MQGFRFVRIVSPCPTGWKSEPAESIELLRLAVDSGLYPLTEQKPSIIILGSDSAEMFVHCQRLDYRLSVEEHHRRPYCFGARDEIATGKQGIFYDYKRGLDPVHFGFPEDGGHLPE